MRQFGAVLLGGLTVLLLLAVGLALFTGYVAYCARRPVLEAYQGPPLGPAPADPAHLGALLDAALDWSLRVCGGVLVILAAGLGVGHAVARGRDESLLGCLAILLAGALLLSQHWAVALAISLLGAAVVAVRWVRRAPPEEGSETPNG
jgi:hypothetical protein